MLSSSEVRRALDLERAIRRLLQRLNEYELRSSNVTRTLYLHVHDGFLYRPPSTRKNTTAPPRVLYTARLNTLATSRPQTKFIRAPRQDVHVNDGCTPPPRRGAFVRLETGSLVLLRGLSIYRSPAMFGDQREYRKVSRLGGRRSP